MADRGPVLVVTSRSRPHEMFAFAAQLLLGVAYLVTVPEPASLSALVPGWLVVLWSAGLVVCGAAGLVSARMPMGVRALELERGALAVSTGTLLLMGGASAAVNGLRSSFGIAMIAAWAGANVWRMVQIRRDVAKLRGSGG